MLEEGTRGEEERRGGYQIKKERGEREEERRVRRVAFEKEVLIWTSSKRVIKTGLEVR